MQLKIIVSNKYVPDQYKTHRMCDKVTLENGETLMFIPDSYKDQNIFNKAVDDYAHTSRIIICSQLL